MKGQLNNFFIWLYENNFLKNLEEKDFKYIIENNDLCLPLLKQNKITIGMNIIENTNFVRIGIDPSDCFNKISSCSIIVKLPLSKRDEKQFYTILEKLIENKSKYSKDWRKIASESWCGEFLTMGNY